MPEATNGADEMFGEERLAEALNRYPDAGPEEVVHHVHDALKQFVHDAPQFDDITMLCFRYHQNGQESDGNGNSRPG